MTQSTVLTRIKTKFYYDELNNAKRLGNPDVAQIIIQGDLNKAAEEAPGLTDMQIIKLKQHRQVTFIKDNELIRYEIQDANEYEQEYNAAIAKRDAEKE